MWKSIFPNHYKEKYQHETGLSGGGGHYPTYDIHINQDMIILPKCNRKSVAVEKFNVPKNWMLLVLNKSTVARLFINFSCSTFIGPAYRGFLTLEIKNSSWLPIKLKKGQPIAQVLALPTYFPCKEYEGKYQDQPNKPINAILKV